MPLPPLDAQAGSAFNGLAADSRSLDQLRQSANQDPAKAVKQVAKQFEALFMQMVLKSMRDASPKSGMLDSSDQQMYTSMLDEQLSQKIAAGGTGLAEVIARQLSRNLPATPDAAPAATGVQGAVADAKSVPAGASPAALLQTLRAATAVHTANSSGIPKSAQDPAPSAVSQ